MNMNDHAHTPRAPYTTDDLADQAFQYARTHRGESPLAWHLNQWAEEVADHTVADNRLLLETAKVILDREIEAAAPTDAAHDNH